MIRASARPAGQLLRGYNVGPSKAESMLIFKPPRRWRRPLASGEIEHGLLRHQDTGGIAASGEIQRAFKQPAFHGNGSIVGLDKRQARALAVEASVDNVLNKVMPKIVLYSLGVVLGLSQFSRPIGHELSECNPSFRTI